MVKYGILVISHGSRSEEWVRLVDEAVAAVELPAGVPISSSFLEIVEGRLIQDGIDMLEADGASDLIVVPLFVSSGSTHIDEIRYALGVQAEPSLPTDLVPFRVQAKVHFASPIDDDPLIAGIVLEKLKGLSRDPSRELVVLVGHGSAEKGFYERWRQGLGRLAERVRQAGGFAASDTALLLPNELPDLLARWHRERPELAAIVAPLFLSEGYFTERVIPERLQGSDHRYAGRALLPHPDIARWIERQIRTIFSPTNG